MNTNSSSPNAFWPISILAVSLIAILLWQLVLGVQAKQSLQAQLTQPQRKTSLEEAKKLQVALEKLVNDLIDTAETDKDAKTIVEKYQIKRNEAPKK
jgi:uncharacterized membrane protein